MLTFFAAFRQKCANPLSLDLSVSAIIADAETVGADLQRTNDGDMKKINNRANPLNIQRACSPSLHPYIHSRREFPLLRIK